jgi:hypothetical protein
MHSIGRIINPKFILILGLSVKFISPKGVVAGGGISDRKLDQLGAVEEIKAQDAFEP